MADRPTDQKHNQKTLSMPKKDSLAPAAYTFALLAPYSPDIVRSPYFEDIIAGLMEELLAHNCDLRWVMIRDNELQDYTLDKLIQRNPDVHGFIILSWRHFIHLVKELEKRMDIPVVMINDFDPNVGLSSIYCDNRSGVRQIWEHFVKRGYKKIGMARGPEYVSPDARERFEEFEKCAQGAGIPLSESHLFESSRFDEEAGYHMMRFWLRKGDLPEAVFCANDDLARGIIVALRENGLKVPDDIAVAGFDDSSRNIFIDPPLTTVRQPLEEIGHAAVKTLIEIVEKKQFPPVRKRFEPHLIVRKSA